MDHALLEMTTLVESPAEGSNAPPNASKTTSPPTTAAAPQFKVSGKPVSQAQAARSSALAYLATRMRPQAVNVIPSALLQRIRRRTSTSQPERTREGGENTHYDDVFPHPDEVPVPSRGCWVRVMRLYRRMSIGSTFRDQLERKLGKGEGSRVHTAYIVKNPAQQNHRQVYYTFEKQMDKQAVLKLMQSRRPKPKGHAYPDHWATQYLDNESGAESDSSRRPPAPTTAKFSPATTTTPSRTVSPSRKPPAHMPITESVTISPHYDSASRSPASTRNQTPTAAQAAGGSLIDPTDHLVRTDDAAGDAAGLNDRGSADTTNTMVTEPLPDGDRVSRLTGTSPTRIDDSPEIDDAFLRESSPPLPFRDMPMIVGGHMGSGYPGRNSATTPLETTRTVQAHAFELSQALMLRELKQNAVMEETVSLAEVLDSCLDSIGGSTTSSMILTEAWIANVKAAVREIKINLQSDMESRIMALEHGGETARE